jgi:hypothetical protein
MADRYKQQGLQRSVEAVLLVHNHGHPHILLLQKPDQSFKLPGGWLRPGEDGDALKVHPFSLIWHICKLIYPLDSTLCC